MDFIVKKINSNDILKELYDVGFDEHYICQGVKKHKFLNLKIYNVSPVQATVIKQTALSSDCDCAIHKDVLGNCIENSNCVLSGSISQLETVCHKLKMQPFSLKNLADLIEIEIKREKTVAPLIMGILNLSENSFSNDLKDPIEHAKTLIEQGADIIDIGAESTKPNAEAVDKDVQIKKIAPVLEFLKSQKQIVSVDTRSSAVADFALSMGADIINDVSFLNYDNNMPETLLKYGKKYVLTHSRGTPDTMDNFCRYENVAETVFNELLEKADALIRAGFLSSNIIVDVGFGFAKNVEQNLHLLKHIEEFKSLGYKILCGISRKRVIQHFAKTNDSEELDFLTSLATFYMAQKNVDIIRVHNVRMARQTLNFAKELI